MSVATMNNVIYSPGWGARCGAWTSGTTATVVIDLVHAACHGCTDVKVADTVQELTGCCSFMNWLVCQQYHAI